MKLIMMIVKKYLKILFLFLFFVMLFSAQT